MRLCSRAYKQANSTSLCEPLVRDDPNIMAKLALCNGNTKKSTFVRSSTYLFYFNYSFMFNVYVQRYGYVSSIEGIPWANNIVRVWDPWSLYSSAEVLLIFL